MKKKIIAIMLGGLIMGMTACGSTSKEATETMSEAVETKTTEDTVTEEPTEKTEEADVTTSEGNEEAVETPTEENKETVETSTEENKETVKTEFTIEQAQEKLLQYLNARPALFDEFNHEDMSCYYSAAEYVGGAADVDFSKLITKDGYQLKYDPNDQESLDKAYIIEACTACEWYYNWVNNGEYMSTSEYIMNHTYDEIVNKYRKDVENGGSITGTFYYADVIMLDAISLAKYMDVNKDNISTGEIAAKGDAPLIKDTVSGVEVAYQLPIFVGPNEDELYLLFDKDGNMLNLVGESEEYEMSLHIDTTDDIFK